MRRETFQNLSFFCRASKSQQKFKKSHTQISHSQKMKFFLWFCYVKLWKLTQILKSHTSTNCVWLFKFLNIFLFFSKTQRKNEKSHMSFEKSHKVRIVTQIPKKTILQPLSTSSCNLKTGWHCFFVRLFKWNVWLFDFSKNQKFSRNLKSHTRKIHVRLLRICVTFQNFW